jgi:DUF971 family protein
VQPAAGYLYLPPGPTNWAEKRHAVTRDTSGTPLEIKLRRSARLLEVTFDDGSRFELPFEYLRVYSPSAEVKGHGPGQETLVLGKEAVGVRAIEPVGQYAVKLVFDDGHDTGLYTWKYLYELGRDREIKWSQYLARRKAQTPSASQ